jgi:hypothetical protein
LELKEHTGTRNVKTIRENIMMAKATRIDDDNSSSTTACSHPKTSSLRHIALVS